jgi:hypothetical protein
LLYICILIKNHKVSIISILLIALRLYIYDKVLLPIKKFFITNNDRILIIFLILSVIVPIIISIKFDWQLPQFLLLYDCFVFIIGSFVLIARNENKYYDQHKEDVLDESWSYYNTEDKEKRNNGGLTNKELIDRKKHIRKKLKL